MARFESLNEAMVAQDELAEAELRYKLLAEVFEAEPKLRGNLNSALVAAKIEITRLRAMEEAAPGASAPAREVVPFDANRFRKSSG